MLIRTITLRWIPKIEVKTRASEVVIVIKKINEQWVVGIEQVNMNFSFIYQVKNRIHFNMVVLIHQRWFGEVVLPVLEHLVSNKQASTLQAFSYAWSSESIYFDLRQFRNPVYDLFKTTQRGRSYSFHVTLEDLQFGMA